MDVYINPLKVDGLASALASRLLVGQKEPVRFIYGIPRGGMPVAYMIAREIERRKPDWPSITVDRADLSLLKLSNWDSSKLIVDDIVDTGDTLRPYIEAGCSTGALLTRKAAEVRPTISGEVIEHSEWIRFPWDEASGLPEDAVVRILEYLEVDPKDPSLKETPRRFLSWLSEFKVNQPEPEITTFEGVHYDQMVIVRDIPFTSLCEHHLLPFVGVGAVAYIPSPDGAVIGLSKLARIVQYYAKRPQVQERMTEEILEHVIAATGGEHAGVVLKAEHMCMSLRGPRAEGHSTITSALVGDFRNDARTREEFLNLANMH